MPTRPDDVPAVPSGATESIHQKLTQARHDAVEALLKAEELEEKARSARRRATVKLKHYERMVLENSGQLTIPMEESSES